jgi:hypothetical protein
MSKSHKEKVQATKAAAAKIDSAGGDQENEAAALQELMDVLGDGGDDDN